MEIFIAEKNNVLQKINQINDLKEFRREKQFFVNVLVKSENNAYTNKDTINEKWRSIHSIDAINGAINITKYNIDQYVQFMNENMCKEQRKEFIETTLFENLAYYSLWINKIISMQRIINTSSDFLITMDELRKLILTWIRLETDISTRYHNIALEE